MNEEILPRKILEWCPPGRRRRRKEEEEEEEEEEEREDLEIRGCRKWQPE